MAVIPASRVNYFDRQHIRLAELRDEQAYHIAVRRRHNITHHTWGIVLGLEIAVENGVPAVRPGIAVDGYGRELVLAEREVLDRARFDERGTNRLDLWLEYGVEYADDRTAAFECDGGDPLRRYRAVERPSITLERAGAADVNPRTPPGVPQEDLAEPIAPGTPDDPRARWPVYLGRVLMRLDDAGQPQFTVDATRRVYAGLNAAVIDHPGSAARIELGLRPKDPETRVVAGAKVEYAPGADRDFAVFVPSTDSVLQPVIAVQAEATIIRGTTEVHGDLILDGTSLQFPDAAKGDPEIDAAVSALYRTGDELRIDLGSLDTAVRTLTIGVTKDDKFHPSLEITYPAEPGAPGAPRPSIVVLGDLRIEGRIESPDVRTRTVTDEVRAMLNGMIQAGIAAGGGS